MPVLLTRADWKELFPKAPGSILDAFVKHIKALDDAGITSSKIHLAFALANAAHETNGYTLPGLKENIKYSAKRMAEIWPSRFANAAEITKEYGSEEGWQKKAFDDIYGGRMGNKPDTSDGSTYIGRGGPQLTGRDAYAQVGSICKQKLEEKPELASSHDLQPEILAAFWTWKNLNTFAKANDFEGCVRKWNGGSIGMSDRKNWKNRQALIIDRLKMSDATPPKEALSRSTSESLVARIRPDHDQKSGRSIFPHKGPRPS